MSESLLLELVVPCFNEGPSIPKLIQEFQQTAKARGLSSKETKLVLVNNGSTDETLSLIENEKGKQTNEWFRIVHLSQNQGYGGGILKGLESSQAPWVGYTHADLQCPLRDAFKCLDKCREFGELSLVRGVRRKRRVADWFVSRFYDLAVGVLWNFWRYDLNAQPKVFSRGLVRNLKGAPRGISFDAFVLYQAEKSGFRSEKIPVFLFKRLNGVSHWANSPWKRIRTFFFVFKELRQSSLTS